MRARTRRRALAGAPVSERMFAENTDLFFDDFALPATIHLTPARAVRVIFDVYPATQTLWDRDSFSERFYESALDSDRPFIHAKESDLIGVGTKITINGADYYVLRVDLTGNGIAQVWLSHDPVA